MLAATGIEPVFPLWGRETTGLAREMLDRGVRATLTRVLAVRPGEVVERDGFVFADLLPE